MRSSLLLPFLLSGSFLLLSSASFASDWEEDAPKRTYIPGHGQGTVILDEKSAPQEAHSGGAGGHVLQGSATAIHTRPAMTSSELAAQTAARYGEAQRLDAEAHRFLQEAQVNVSVPPAVFKAFVEKQHPGFLLSAENNAKSLILVHGQWDDSNKPLSSLGIKYDSIKTKALPEATLDQCKVMIIDCAGEIPRASIQKIRDYVLRGGYLLTTDWSLQNVIERCFPNYVKWNGDNTEGVITDAFIMEPDPRLMSGVTGRRFTWKLDRMSQCVRILQPDRVHIIARSSMLARHDPQLRVLPDPMLAGTLALEFSFGRGKVLHLVGHFDNCANSFRPQLLPDPAPGAGISLRQVLAANFIVEAMSKKSEP